jgi:hypothetical protein
MLPTISTAFRGYLRTAMMANNLAWSINPTAFLKSMYVRYISLLVNRAFSRAAISVCICREVLRCGRKPS